MAAGVSRASARSVAAHLWWLAGITIFAVPDTADTREGRGFVLRFLSPTCRTLYPLPLLDLALHHRQTALAGLEPDIVPSASFAVPLLEAGFARPLDGEAPALLLVAR